MLFADLCRIEQALPSSECAAALVAVKLLDDSKPYKEVNGRKVWHPVWLKSINDQVNISFIQEITNTIYKNEKVSELMTCHCSGADMYLTDSL